MGNKYDPCGDWIYKFEYTNPWEAHNSSVSSYTTNVTWTAAPPTSPGYPTPPASPLPEPGPLDWLRGQVAEICELAWAT